MQSETLDTDSRESDIVPTLGRPRNRSAILVVLAIHLVLLAIVLTSRWRAPTPPKLDRSTEVVIYLPTPKPKPPPPPPKAEPKPPEAASPPPPRITPPVVAPQPVPEPPKPAPDPVPAPVRDAPPAPGPVAAPPAAVATPAAPPAAATTKLFSECADTPDRRMVADVYKLPVNTRSLSVMDRRKPLKRVCMTQLDIAPRDFREGFPGLDVYEWFGLDIRFTVTAPVEGNYDIMVLSDDGSTLSIDGKQVIENDGVHAPNAVMATVALTKGPHAFRVRYFQGPAPGIALMLAWKKEGGKDYGLIPQRFISRPAADDLPPMPQAPPPG